MQSLQEALGAIYKVRYSYQDEQAKMEIWRVLVEEWLQKYIDPQDSVLDVAAGHCEFINLVTCKKKIAIDVDVRVKKYAHSDVSVIITSAEKMPRKLTNSIDVVFMGCFLEHLPSKNEIVQVFSEVYRILRSGGRLLILNPNIRFLASEYWDYFDHLTPVSDRSITEILKALGFTIDVCLPRFVPNTIKDQLPKSPLLVRWYLRMPWLFPIFGRQMFIVARKE